MDPEILFRSTYSEEYKKAPGKIEVENVVFQTKSFSLYRLLAPKDKLLSGAVFKGKNAGYLILITETNHGAKGFYTDVMLPGLLDELNRDTDFFKDADGGNDDHDEEDEE